MSDEKDTKLTPIKRPPGQKLTDEERAIAQRKFLVSFAQQANVRLAAKAAKVARNTIYEWLEHDTDFSLAYNQAKEDAKDVLRAEIYRRGHTGWDEKVYQIGKFAGKVRKYSDTLLIFHAKMMMPEYRDKQQIEVHTDPQTQDVQAKEDAIMKALEPYPEAKWALAEAIAELERTSKPGSKEIGSSTNGAGRWT